MKRPEGKNGSHSAQKRWQQAEEIVSMALDCASEQWPALLDEACADDAELRAEVASLLACQAKVAGFPHFIEQPIMALAPELFPDPDSATPNQRLGSYQLLSEIGRGGMGSVYLAERADEQYQKLVAIKIVRRGMDTDDILRRFRNERQILASLDHPNIARLLDGGTTDGGLPYLVMEYVEGISVTDYCDRQRLSTNDRLHLFRTICAAVQHAHQNLVIHRDLKPSNILITAEGVPKLLDFGIAKVFNRDVVRGVEHTLTGLPAFTPYYASPEQIRGGMLTTASDVYSLGILLYELLTGLHPYRSRHTLPLELGRIIPEQEPAKPSTIVVSSEILSQGSTKERPGITPESVSRARNTQPEKLRRRLAGDLDNIILMALRKEPSRRYISVDQLAEDVHRHLDGLPVIARSDTLRYRASKFTRRNRLGVSAAVLILLSLVGGMVATAWQARAAQREKAKAESVSAFLKKMLTSANPVMKVPGATGGETTMKEALDEAAKRLDSSEFSNQLDLKAELEKIIADSYFGQGKQDLWELHLRKYIALQRGLYGENDPRTIEANSVLAMLYFRDQNFAESEKLYRRVLPLLNSEYHKGTISASEFAAALSNFGYLRRTQGDSKEAELIFRETLTLSPQIPAEQHFWIGLTRCTLASTLSDQGRFDEALQTAQEAVTDYRQGGFTGAPDFGFSLTVLGGFLAERGDFADADKKLNEGEQILRQLQSPSSLWLGDNLRNQAISFYQQSRYAESETRIREAEKIYLESFGTGYDHYPTVLIVKGLILDKTGKSTEGEVYLRQAVKFRSESLPKGHFWTAVANSALGECLTTQKRFSEAEPLLVESYESLKSTLGPRDPRTAVSLRRLVALYTFWSNSAQAEKYRNLSLQNQ